MKSSLLSWLITLFCALIPLHEISSIDCISITLSRREQTNYRYEVRALEYIINPSRYLNSLSNTPSQYQLRNEYDSIKQRLKRHYTANDSSFFKIKTFPKFPDWTITDWRTKRLEQLKYILSKDYLNALEQLLTFDPFHFRDYHLITYFKPYYSALFLALWFESQNDSSYSKLYQQTALECLTNFLWKNRDQYTPFAFWDPLFLEVFYDLCTFYRLFYPSKEANSFLDTFCKAYGVKQYHQNLLYSYLNEHAIGITDALDAETSYDLDFCGYFYLSMSHEESDLLLNTVPKLYAPVLLHLSADGSFQINIYGNVDFGTWRQYNNTIILSYSSNFKPTSPKHKKHLIKSSRIYELEIQDLSMICINNRCLKRFE